MLKGIDERVSPDLLYLLAKMGHGDKVVIADKNYPAYTAGLPVIHLPGMNATQAIELVCTLFPLDSYTVPLGYMVSEYGEEIREVTREVIGMCSSAEHRNIESREIERLAFYEEAKNASFVIATSESRPFGCYILTKGVL